VRATRPHKPSLLLLLLLLLLMLLMRLLLLRVIPSLQRLLPTPHPDPARLLLLLLRRLQQRQRTRSLPSQTQIWRPPRNIHSSSPPPSTDPSTPPTSSTPSSLPSSPPPSGQDRPEDVLAIHDEGSAWSTGRYHVGAMWHLLRWQGHRQMMRMVRVSSVPSVLLVLWWWLLVLLMLLLLVLRHMSSSLRWERAKVRQPSHPHR